VPPARHPDLLVDPEQQRQPARRDTLVALGEREGPVQRRPA
jgi:hypothetical protein